MFISFCFFLYFALEIPLAIHGHIRRVNPLECTPTEVLQSECYSCRCSAQGYYWCWPKTCSYEEKKKKLAERSSQSVEPNCQPGVFYQTQNLTCSCSGHGVWYTDECKNALRTLKQIEEPASEIQKLVTKNQGLLCKPGSLYVADCNICVCSKDGYFHISLCTKRNCKMHHSKKCRPGSVVRTRCHICSCSLSNRFDPKNCIKVPCDSDFKEIDAESLSEIDSRIGRSEHRRNVKEHGVFECVPKTNYMLDCNKCYCREDGSPTCTLMGCLDPVDVATFNSGIKNHGFGDEQMNAHDVSDRIKRDINAKEEVERNMSKARRGSRKDPSDRVSRLEEELSDSDEIKWAHEENKTVHDDLSNEVRKDTVLKSEIRDISTHSAVNFTKKGHKGGEKEFSDMSQVEDKGSRKDFEKVTFVSNANFEENIHGRSKKDVSKHVSVRMKRDEDSYDEFEEINSDSDACERGNIYRMDCNSCICVKSGDLACTTRVCEGNYDYVNNNNNPQFILPETDRF